MDRRIGRRALLSAALGAPALLRIREWRAGAASRPITPLEPIWMAGYAARTKPSEGVLQELYVRALALDDGTGRPAVLVSTDLLGLPRSLADRIADRAASRFGIRRARLHLNSTHTHGGPVVGETLRVAYPGMGAEHEEAVRRYTERLETDVVDCIGSALQEMFPARLAFGRTTVGFAMNRRQPAGTRNVAIGVNPQGPVDHDVPFLKVEDSGGRVRAIAFGYACHNTTLGGDVYHIHGDYAGFAQAALEKSHPGSVALFITGCGGDANPNPRGLLGHAIQHGESLAKAVSSALSAATVPVEAPLRAAFGVTSIDFAPIPDRAGWNERLKSSDRYVRKHAEMMLAILDRRGAIPASYPYPAQVWRFADGLTLIGLAGEVVVDFALRFKREIGGDRTWVAAYSNDVFAYIPSLRVLREGGYEAGGAMIYYGQPGPFAETVEEAIVRQVHKLRGQLVS